MTDKLSLNARTLRDDMAVGRVVKRVRKDMGMSQGALAEAIGVTFQQVQKYEKGTNRIAMGTFFLICKALDVPPATMLDQIIVEKDWGVIEV